MTRTKMANIKTNVTLKQEFNPVQYAINHLFADETAYCLELVSFSCKEDEIKPAVRFIDMRMKYVADIKHVSQCIAYCYYNQCEMALASKIANYEKKTSPTEKQRKVYENMIECQTGLLEIIGAFPAEITAVAKNDIFSNACAGAFSGNFSTLSKLGVSLNDVLKVLDTAEVVGKDGISIDLTKINVKDLREKATAFTKSITGEKDGLYNGYHLNCNSALAEEIKSAFYRGRTTDKAGNVVQKLDKDGNAVRKEIVLAIIEDLQKKWKKEHADK